VRRYASSVFVDDFVHFLHVLLSELLRDDLNNRQSDFIHVRFSQGAQKYVFFNGIAIETRSQYFMRLLYNLPEF
jgi:hypothetical protein